MTRSIIENPAPLQSNYVPSEFLYRDEERETLHTFMSSGSSGVQTLFVHGPRGTGKTHHLLSQLEDCPGSAVSCYVPCHRFDTQYKALKQLYRAVTQEEPADGHHTAALQRTIENRTRATEVMVVLDELEFILHNDGDDLLYFLSRLDTDLSLVLVSTTIDDLGDHLEERTFSSLQPETLTFEQYTAEQAYTILAERARAALEPQSIHRQALTHISSTVQNLLFDLHWLRTAAEAAGGVVTENLVVETRERAYRTYVTELLDPLSEHHDLLHQAVTELWMEREERLLTGDIYDQYQDLCTVYETEMLSHRRISDFLTHLEYLELVDADYHYGGDQGKTREIRPPENLFSGQEM